MPLALPCLTHCDKRAVYANACQPSHVTSRYIGSHTPAAAGNVVRTCEPEYAAGFETRFTDEYPVLLATEVGWDCRWPCINALSYFMLPFLGTCLFCIHCHRITSHYVTLCHTTSRIHDQALGRVPSVLLGATTEGGVALPHTLTTHACRVFTPHHTTSHANNVTCCRHMLLYCTATCCCHMLPSHAAVLHRHRPACRT